MTQIRSHWNESIKRNTIHALRNIENGTEITRYYLSDNDGFRKSRQKQLEDRYGFKCKCFRCTLEEEKRIADDRRVVQLHVLTKQIQDVNNAQLHVTNSLKIFRFIAEEFQLLRKQNLGAPTHTALAVAYESASRVAIMNKDVARARIFLERVISLYSTTYGNDNREVIASKVLANNPRSSPDYGIVERTKRKNESFEKSLNEARAQLAKKVKLNNKALPAEEQMKLTLERLQGVEKKVAKTFKKKPGTADEVKTGVDRATRSVGK